MIVVYQITALWVAYVMALAISVLARLAMNCYLIKYLVEVRECLVHF